jgi:hypothetical protein
MEEVTGYELSRQWFDYCYENPELITPTHTALYFFAIEHCNRLGWKEKFGLPTQMAMDGLGVKSWRAYSKAFNDIVEWGFFKVHQKSKNQYSATVIAIVKNTKAKSKALTKAMQKHRQKHSNLIAVIDKPDNHITKEPNNSHSWRDNFDEYISLLNDALQSLKCDPEYIAKQESYYPGLDVIKTLDKAFEEYWSTEAAWKHKKRSRATDINWKATLTNAIALQSNKVYKSRSTITPPEKRLTAADFMKS